MIVYVPISVSCPDAALAQRSPRARIVVNAFVFIFVSFGLWFFVFAVFVFHLYHESELDSAIMFEF